MSTVGRHNDVREGRISFEVEGRFVVFSHRKEDAVSPHSSILDALPLFPECDMEDDSIEIPTIFPPKFPDLGSLFIPCIVGKVGIERGLCDLGASVSIMPYSLFHRLHRGPLLVAPFSLQLADHSVTQPIGKLDDVPVNPSDI